MRALRIAVGVMAFAAAMAVPTSAHSAAGGVTAAEMGVTVTAGAGLLAGPSCPSGYFCVWRYTNPGSDVNRYEWYGSDGDYRNNYWSDGVSLNDSPSAILNNSSQNMRVRMYAGYNYTSTSAHPGNVCLSPGWGFPDLRDIGWDNSGSSHSFSTTGC
ncbi:hypothetical protein F4553_007085 [Allocatelliglobosispora scoriae]|uniref:Peptidase inhibitor family I36 n=1 Tax=Allocatelliglobosispora scoriae TaxID=643052 RepID=A0A841C4A0_9ACTN|nr:peptidase inhibitor family I36 protein [Allocatelliglobosispora scoriae]MBB5873651.1 hypothetical protein [Allocatelliglobosispora scoriae]